MLKTKFLFSIFLFTLFSININATEVQRAPVNAQVNNNVNTAVQPNTNNNNVTNADGNTFTNTNVTNTLDNNLTQNMQNNGLEPKNVLYIELKDGVVIAELFPTKAPLHVQRIRTLTQEGFYDGLKFHRVIDGFMAQTGDPTGTGRGGSRLGKLYAEFNDEHHTKGTLSMARASDPNSANSQFFIVTGDFFPELDGQYTVFGRVIDGMDYVEKIKTGDVAKNGMVENPDIMIKVVTGDMLNNKSVETVKEEIKVVEDMQNDKKNQDPNYQKKSVLEILLETKDIDINQPAILPGNTQQNIETKDTNNTMNATTTNNDTKVNQLGTQQGNTVNNNNNQNTQQQNVQQQSQTIKEQNQQPTAVNQNNNTMQPATNNVNNTVTNNIQNATNTNTINTNTNLQQ